MMYQNKLAVAIKNNGKVLREFKDSTYVPFGTEYSIFIKNLNSVRVRVNVEIDGKDIADGDSFIIGAGHSMDLERFLKNGNMNAGNRFKFIERTSRVEAHRGGAQVEDGLVRIMYEFEKEPAPTQWRSSPHTLYSSSVARGFSGASGSLQSYGTSAGASASAASEDFITSANASLGSVMNMSSTSMESLSNSSAPHSLGSKSIDRKMSYKPTSMPMPKNEAGITAAGSISEQQFKSVSDIDGDGVKHVMILRILGEVGQNPVEVPITVKHRPVCDSCGKINKATANFCNECGTSLVIV